MKLKSIIALALVALMASCTLNSRLKKLEKAVDKGEVKEAIEIVEKIVEKYDEPKDWNLEQANRFAEALDDLGDEIRDDYDKYESERKDLNKLEEKFEKNMKADCK